MYLEANKVLRNIIEFIISSIKGSEYKIDKEVSLGYLLSLSMQRFVMMIRGSIIFKTFNLVFIGSNVTIKEKSKIRFQKGLTIQKDCYIDALSKMGLRLGKNVSFARGCTVECTGSLKHLGRGLLVGDNVGFSTNCFLGCAGGIEIGSDIIIGNYVTFHSKNHNYDNPKMPIRLQGVTHKGIKVGKNCWIGAKATILDGVTIEDGCIIAAGALVQKGTYEANCIYGGVPAKKIGSRF
jgi:acetyltransferase-like isoleucine patch superfamily enzyme